MMQKGSPETLPIGKFNDGRNMTDEEVVEKIIEGDTELFAELIERYEKKLGRYIGHIINQGREDVEDVVEETLIAGYKNLLAFNPKLKFSSWIYRIGHNQAIDWMRKNRLKTEPIEEREEFIDNAEEEIEDRLIREETEDKIWELIGKLPKQDRELVDLYYFEDQTYRDLADIFRISTNNVAVRLNRAKKRLKYLWENQNEKKS